MGLSASMYSGTSGLKAHGEKMTVIGNNISNVSTIGYKASRMYFEDALSQQITTAAGPGQVGRGVAVGAVMGDFSQGSLETTNESTDLAIGGAGFFVVSPPGQEINYYTRAGNFRFNEDGYLVDPHGYTLQGWAVQQSSTSIAATGDTTAKATAGVKTKGVPTDIKLENFQSPPQATGRVDMIVNVDSQSEDKSTGKAAAPVDDAPFTALFDAYDSTNPDGPLGDSRYAYQSTIKVYDENGSSHNLTVYMDPVNYTDITENSGGKRYWEYIITVPPNEDNREFWGDANVDPKMRGVLMAGTLTFNAAGDLENMSAFTINNPYPTIADEPDPTAVPPTEGTYGDVSNATFWTPAHFSQNGYPMCTANFLGAKYGSVTTSETGPDDPLDQTPNIPTLLGENTSKNIEINFGLRNKATTWGPAQGVEVFGNLAALRDVDNSDGGLTGTTTGDFLNAIPGFASTDISALSTTNYSTGSTTIFQSQDGYTSGFLQNISVDRDGVITGRYSNGQVLQLFAVTLATFNNNYALFREGGNLFAETRSSGPPITGLANTGGKGSIASNSLEGSNVDLATEFVKMITTEKGFQANSKTITTVDQMLTVLIQLKR